MTDEIQHPELLPAKKQDEYAKRVEEALEDCDLKISRRGEEPIEEGGLTELELRGFQNFALLDKVTYDQALRLAIMTPIEYGLAMGFLQIAVARHTKTRERMQAITKLSEREGMFVFRARERMKDTKDLATKELVWRFCKKMGIKEMQTETFEEYEHGKILDTKAKWALEEGAEEGEIAEFF